MTRPVSLVTPGYLVSLPTRSNLAVVPDGRGQGLGAALLNEAERQARANSCPGLALIVAATNLGAISVYKRAGYIERARRPFDLTAFGEEPTEAILMVKDLV